MADQTETEAGAASSGNQTHHQVDEELLKPLWIATTIARRPCAVYWVTLVLVLILTAIDATDFTLSLEGDDRTLLVESDDYSIWYDGWVLAQEYADDAGTGDLSVNETIFPQTEDAGAYTVFMMFHSKDDNFILTPSNLETIIEYEEKVTLDPTWQDYFCFVTNTLTYECNFFSLAQVVMDHFDYDYDAISTQDVLDYVWELHSQGNPMIVASFGEGYASSNYTKYYRSFLNGGGPLPTEIETTNSSLVIKSSIYQDLEDDYDAQEKEFEKKFGNDFFEEITVKHEGDLTKNGLRIVCMIFASWTEYLFILFFGSIPFVFMAMLVVVAWMTFHLESIFLSCLGVIGIMLAFPFAYFIYNFIYGIGYFDFLSSLIIFVLLGVGADDVFVFTDAWHQSVHFVNDPTNDEERLTYTYRRAAKAMLVTQITTFFAFMATASSVLLPIAAFGYWASLVVAADYILVITMYPSVLMMHHYYFKSCESKYLCCCCFKKPACPCLRNLPESSSSSAATSQGTSNAISNASKPPADTSGAPGAAGAADTAGAETKPQEVELAARPEFNRSASVMTDGGVEPLEYRGVERFCGVTWANFIIKIKYPILGVFLVIFGVSVYLMVTGIEPLDEAEGAFVDGHFMQEVLDLSAEFGAAEEDGLAEVIVAWGINGVNRDGSNRWDVDDYGKLKWDSSFDMSSYDAQMFMYRACQNLSNSDIVFSAGTTTCPLDSLVNYTDANGMNFPWTYENPDSSSYDADTQKRLFAEFLYNFSTSGEASAAWGAEELVYIETPDSRSDGNYYVRYFALKAKIAVTFSTSRSDRIELRDSWDEFLQDEIEDNSECPPSVCSPIQVSTTWTFIESQAALVRSAVQGIAIALPIAFLVMIFSTSNWIVAIYAILDIVGVMACGLSVISIAGWQFGTAESVSIVLIIGFSVDYVVHLANAYLESGSSAREERLKYALLTMGVSVGSGAVTTFLAGVFLLFPSFLLFFKMGIMMLATIFWSIVWAMFFFIALLAAWGPEGEKGNIPFKRWFEKTKVWCKSQCGK